MPEFNLEQRYTVIKHKDAHRILTTTEQLILMEITKKVQEHRVYRGKADLECLVIERDWPEYQPAEDALKSRVEDA